MVEICIRSGKCTSLLFRFAFYMKYIGMEKKRCAYICFALIILRNVEYAGHISCILTVILYITHCEYATRSTP